MNLEAFYAAYRVDGRSRPPYDPAMMVALLLYAYARGIRSSRVIERACEEDVAFRVLAAQQRPDHATIARSALSDNLTGRTERLRRLSVLRGPPLLAAGPALVGLRRRLSSGRRCS